MPLTPEHVTHYNSLQVEFAEQYVFGEKDFLWLRECWPIVNATGLARGLRFSPNSGLTCAGK
ncbi:hypothetical protein BANRA_05409 [Escherichia coli]|nr:hypothetical protein BANRA_05409 [Escherichia coli]